MFGEIKFLFSRILKQLSPVFYVKQKYYRIFGTSLDLVNPQGFNEKICWLALYWQKPIVVKCADKYELREYVSSLGLMELMPQLYGVYTDVKGIEWNRFPKKFVIKCTHGCKYNIVCFNKDELDIHSADISLNKWLHSVYGTNTYEPHYSKMTPRIILKSLLKLVKEYFRKIIRYIVLMESQSVCWFALTGSRNLYLNGMILNGMYLILVLKVICVGLINLLVWIR